MNTAIIATITSSYTQEDMYLFDCIKRNDDFKAFEILFKRYEPYLHRYVQKMVACEYHSEEIVSDVFVKIWKNRKELTITTSVKAYLRMCVRNLSIDHLRRQTRLRNAQSQLPCTDNQTEDSPEATFIHTEMSNFLEQAIKQLPPKGRYIFQLSRNEGKKYREIASELEISIKTVETHMRRSLIHLRGALARYQEMTA